MENKLTTSLKVDLAFEDLLQRTIDITPKRADEVSLLTESKTPPEK